jgi:hypothetical protein
MLVELGPYIIVVSTMVFVALVALMIIHVIEHLD